MEFELYKYELLDRDYDFVARDATDAAGVIEIEGLEYGMYKLVEVYNPNPDYQITDSDEILFNIRTREVLQMGEMVLTNAKAVPMTQLY